MLGQASHQRPVPQGCHSSNSTSHRGINVRLPYVDGERATKLWTVECLGVRVCKISPTSDLGLDSFTAPYEAKAFEATIDVKGGLILPSLVFPRGSVIHIYIWTSVLFLIDVEILSKGRKNFFPLHSTTITD